MNRFLLTLVAVTLLVAPAIAADNPCPCDTAKVALKLAGSPAHHYAAGHRKHAVRNIAPPVTYRATTPAARDTVYIERAVAPQVVVQPAAAAAPCPKCPDFVAPVKENQHPVTLSVMAGTLLGPDTGDGFFDRFFPGGPESFILGGVGVNVPFGNATFRPSIMVGNGLVRTAADVMHFWTWKSVKPYLGGGLVGDWDRNPVVYCADDNEAEYAHNHHGEKSDRFFVQPSGLAGIQWNSNFAPFLEGRWTAGDNEARRWYLGGGLTF